MAAGWLLAGALACRRSDPSIAVAAAPAPRRTPDVPVLGLAPPCAAITRGHCPGGEPTVYVAPGGDDRNEGSAAQPYASVGRALAEHTTGTIRVRAGTYAERVVVPTQARSGCDWLSIIGEPGATLTADGAGSAERDDLIYLEGAEQVCISGLNLQGGSGLDDASGVRVFGSGRSIWLLNNTIEHFRGRSAMGITAYGADGPGISELIVHGNQIRNCEPAPSEALVVNGNVAGFLISENVVEDVNNIGIDVIGGEAWLSASHPRGGVLSGNRVSRANSNYEDGAAAGIYVDGASDITIERNQVGGCDFGIEVGAENAGVEAKRITVRNNFIFNNFKGGLIVGGHESTAGRVVDSQLIHNSLYANNRPKEATRFGYRGAPNGEVILQYVDRLRVENNIFFAHGSAETYVATWGRVRGLTLERNLYFAPKGSPLRPPAADRTAVSGDPGFVAPQLGNLRIASGSAAIDKATVAGADDDFDAQERPAAAADLGADEFAPDSGAL